MRHTDRRIMRTRYIVWCLAILATSSWGCMACAQAPATGYEHLNESIDDELAKIGLGAGDVFEVRVYGEDELTRVYRVPPSGRIHFPLVNEVHVAGKTPREIEDEVRSRLMEGYIRDPFVSIYVQEYNSKKVFVLGQVARPGTFNFQRGMNVVEVISLAGGFKPSANPDYVVVTRKVDGEEQRIPVPVEQISKGLATNLALQSGDIIFVPDTLL
jgi:protein involved in polysaccharide export with SLBB domain